MGDLLVLGVVLTLVGFIVYYLIKQKQHHGHSDLCAGCTDHHSSCGKCDVDTLKKELKEELRKSS